MTDDQFQKLMARFDAVDVRIESLEERADAHQKALMMVAGICREMASDIHNLDRASAETGRKVDDLHNWLTQTQQNIADLREVVDA